MIEDLRMASFWLGDLFSKLCNSDFVRATKCSPISILEWTAGLPEKKFGVSVAHEDVYVVVFDVFLHSSVLSIIP